MSNANSQLFNQFQTKHQERVKENKQSLRKELRKLRRNLSPVEQKIASRNFIKQINSSQLLLKHSYIALYLGNDGELNPEILIKQLWKKKKQVFLPVIHPLSKNSLRFCLIDSRTKFTKNRFGILEPVYDPSKLIQRRFLSLVLMPLVAFDKTGNRMGMGGGFYDRSFAYKAKLKNSKPKLIGVAHHFQEKACLPTEAWDIPLDGICTDKHYYNF